VAENPDLPWTHRSLGLSHFYAGRFDSAEIEFQQIGLKGWQSEVPHWIVINRFYQGELTSALEFLEEKKRSKDQRTRERACRLELSVYDLLGDKDKARASWLYEKTHLYVTWRLSQKRGGDTFFVDSLLALDVPDAYYLGNTNEALRLCDRLSQQISQNDLGGQYALDCSLWRARIFYTARRFNEASNEYQTVLREERKTIHRYRLADCYYRLKKYRGAKDILVQIKKNEEPVTYWIDFAYAYPRTFYLLGKVNEALGDAAGAMKAYQQFLEIWKEADKDLPELIDAKVRAAKLSGGK